MYIHVTTAYVFDSDRMAFSIKCWEYWVPLKLVLGGVRDVARFHYPSCTDSIKPSLQFSCNFVVINSSDGSLCFQTFTQKWKWLKNILFAILNWFTDLKIFVRGNTSLLKFITLTSCKNIWNFHCDIDNAIKILLNNLTNRKEQIICIKCLHYICKYVKESNIFGNPNDHPFIKWSMFSWDGHLALYTTIKTLVEIRRHR
jgi:hypothetical protein